MKFIFTFTITLFFLPFISWSKILKSNDFINQQNIISNKIPDKESLDNQYSSKYEFQKNAMKYVALILNAIKKTDYDKAISGLNQLKTINFKNVTSPLSLLYDLINGIGDGREDFLVLGFKHVLFSEIRRIAQNVFHTVVKQKKYVSINTKNNTLEKLKLIRKNLDPTKEACAGIMKNIDYIIAVVEKLPENNSQLKEMIMFTSNLISVITKKDIEALKSALKSIHNQAKKIYYQNLLNQITIVEATSEILLNQNKPEFFKELIYLYKSTNLPEVKYEIIKILGKIARSYYGGDINNQKFADPAYKSFELLLKIANSKKILSLSSLWWIRCAAAEELILLEHKLQDPNAKKTVDRYLKELEKKEENKNKKFIFKFGKKIGKDSSSDYVLCVLKNREQIYNMKLIDDSLKNISKNNRVYLSVEDMLIKSLENQKEILKKLSIKEAF